MNLRNGGALSVVLVVLALLVAPLASQAAPLQGTSAESATDGVGGFSTALGQLWSELVSLFVFSPSGAAAQAVPTPQNPAAVQTTTEFTTLDQEPSGDAGAQIDPAG